MDKNLRPTWKRKDLKKKAKIAFKHNYWRSVLVCVLLAFVVGSYASTLVLDPTQSADAVYFRIPSNSDVVNAVIRDATGIATPGLPFGVPEATHGALAAIFNSANQSGSFLFGILNAVNQFAFGDKVLPGIIILIGVVIMLFYELFVSNILRVGECRFFLETRRYHGTAPSRLLFIYKLRRTRHTALILLRKAIYIILWCLTIVGAPMAYYATRMVEWILAENPDVTYKEAMALSKAMMRGQKWRAFVYDVSYIWWLLLSAVTFGLVGIFYVNPYISAGQAELYMRLREAAIENGLPGAEKLNDKLLDVPAPAAGTAAPGCYPVDEFTIPEHPGRKWLTTDYHRKYTLPNLVLLFFAFCMVGWVWEVIVDVFYHGTFTNRGTLLGPWLPLYGSGGVLILLLTKKWIDKPVVVFLMTVTICGVVEYFTGWFLETTRGVRYWNYDGYLLNIQGRVCLEGLLVFGIVGCLGIYLLAPILDDAFNKIPRKAKLSLCAALIVLFSCDVAWSFTHPRKATNVSFPLRGQEDSSQSAAAGTGS